MWMLTGFIFVQAFFPQLLGFSNFIPIIYANQRLVWSLVVSWIIIACRFGYGGILNTFFSAKVWMPIEKIGLSLYIIHPSVMISHVQKRRSPVDFDIETIVSWVTIETSWFSFSFTVLQLSERFIELIDRGSYVLLGSRTAFHRD